MLPSSADTPVQAKSQSENKPGSNPIPLHPILFASYFVLSLLGSNISQLYPGAAVRSLLIALVMAGFLLILMRLIFMDWQRGALATSLLLVLFFSYGHVYDFLEKNLPALGHHRLLLPLWSIGAGLRLRQAVKLHAHQGVEYHCGCGADLPLIPGHPVGGAPGTG
jgi:cytochrome c oxidase subunit IV